MPILVTRLVGVHKGIATKMAIGAGRPQRALRTGRGAAVISGIYFGGKGGVLLGVGALSPPLIEAAEDE